MATHSSFVDSSTLNRASERLAWLLAAALLIAAAAAVRVVAARDDFWLDEIASLVSFADSARSAFDIFKVRHDNNHFLVTLWMYWCGPDQSWLVYRLPSVFAGTGTVVLSAVIARRWGMPAAMAATVLTASSYVLIVYASEARGYALAGFFALVAFLALERHLVTRGLAAAITFWLATALGFLAHLTFFHFYLAALVWAVVFLWKSEPYWPRFCVALARCQAVPLGFLIAFYLFEVRGMEPGGGNPYFLPGVIIEVLAYSVGGAGWLAASMALCAAAWELARLRIEKFDLALFFAVALFLSPLLVLLLVRPPAVYPRYFYINILFFLLLLSDALGRIDRWDAAGRPLAIVALALIVRNDTARTWEFLKVGRGEYAAAVRYMAEQSSEPEIHVEGDQDYRDGLVLRYYAARLLRDRALVYHPQSAVSPEPPEWFVLHSQEQPWQPAPAITDPHGHRGRYVLDAVFPYTGLSGYHWAVYHRAD